MTIEDALAIYLVQNAAPYGRRNEGARLAAWKVIVERNRSALDRIKLADHLADLKSRAQPEGWQQGIGAPHLSDDEPKDKP